MMNDTRAGSAQRVVFPRLLSLAIGIDRLIAHRDAVLQRCLDDLATAGEGVTPSLRAEADEYLRSLLERLCTGNMAGHLEFLRERLRRDAAARSRWRAIRSAARRACLAVLSAEIEDGGLLGAVLLALNDLARVERDLGVRSGPRRRRGPDPVATADVGLAVPVPRGNPRPRLVALLHEALSAKVVCVSAGAGYGKSTTVAHYLGVHSPPHCWCTLGAGDADADTLIVTLAQTVGRHDARSYQPSQALRAALSCRREALLIILDRVEILGPTALALLEELIADSAEGVRWLLVGQLAPTFTWSGRSTPPSTRYIGPDALRATDEEIVRWVAPRSRDDGQSAWGPIIAAASDGWPAAIALCTLRAASPLDPSVLPRLLEPFVESRALASVPPAARQLLERIAAEEARGAVWNNPQPGAELALLRNLGYVIPAGDGVRVLAPILASLQAQLPRPPEPGTTGVESRSVRQLQLTAIAGGLDIRLLGDLEVRRDGRPIEGVAWRKRKVRALLTLLALQRSPVHRDVLLEALWPTLDIASALNNLKFTVHHLRRALEPELTQGRESRFVVYQADHYALHWGEQVVVDAVEFARLAERGLRESEGSLALALLTSACIRYRGELVPEFRYEDWALRQRERLADLWLDAQERAANLLAGQDQYKEALDVCQSALDADPCRESLHRLAMECYLCLGDRAAALRQYDRAERALQRELGTGPDAFTTELLRRCRDISTPPARRLTTALTAG